MLENCLHFCGKQNGLYEGIRHIFKAFIFHPSARSLRTLEQPVSLDKNVNLLPL